MGVGEFVGKLVNNFSFHNIWLSILVTFLIIGGIMYGLFWFWSKKMQFKYAFELLDSQGNSQLRKAKIVRNKQGIRKFCIEGFERPDQWQSINIEPTRIINGKNYRQVAFDGKGNIAPTTGLNLVSKDLTEEELNVIKKRLKDADIEESYITKFKLDKKKYLETSLTEVEKTIQAYSILEANQDHNILDKAQKWQIGIIAMLCVFMLMMLFFQVKGIVQMTQATSSTAGVFDSAGDKLVRVAESIDRRTRMEELLYKQVYGDNFSLELTAS